jgi:hypothetical protein
MNKGRRDTTELTGEQMFRSKREPGESDLRTDHQVERYHERADQIILLTEVLSKGSWDHITEERGTIKESWDCTVDK